MGPCEAAEERFRNLFLSLDRASKWTSLLTESQLVEARYAAASSSAWHVFLKQPSLLSSRRTTFPLSSPPAVSPSSAHSAPPSPSRDVDVFTMEPPGDASDNTPLLTTPPPITPPTPPSASNQSIPSPSAHTSAVVRRQLAIASVDAHFFQTSPPSPTLPEPDMYESDHGLMSGDDGGHTAYSDLLCDERRRQRHQTGVITLLGYHHPILPNPSVPSNAALSAKRRRIRRKAAQYTTGILGASEMFQTHARESTTPQDVVMPNSASDDEEHTLDASNYHVPYLDADVNCWPVANGASCDVEARRPYPPIFDDGSFSSARHGHKRKREGAGRSLVTVLTRQNPVVRNVVAFKKLCALRKAAISVLLKGGGGGGVSIKTENVIDDSSVVVSPVKKEENLLATVSKGGSETQVNGRADQKEIGSSGCDILEIENCSQAVSGVGRASVGQGDKSEEHAMTRAVCALICAHSGVTHASESALEVLTDTVEMFIHEIGTILSTCRQNIDNNQVSVCKENNQRRGKTKDEVFEEMRIICSSGLRGGFAELYDYAKVSILKTEFAIKETMGKICQKLQSKEGGAVLKAFRNSVGRGVDLDMSSGLSEGGGEEEDRVVVREEDVSIEDEAFVFGYLHRSIWLDILDSIKVPRRLVFETGLETS